MKSILALALTLKLGMSTDMPANMHCCFHEVGDIVKGPSTLAGQKGFLCRKDGSGQDGRSALGDICPDISEKTGKTAKRTTNFAAGDFRCSIKGAEGGVTTCEAAEDTEEEKMAKASVAARFIASFTGPDGEYICPLDYQESLTEEEMVCVKDDVESKQWDTKVLSPLQLEVFDVAVTRCTNPTHTVVKGHADVDETVPAKEASVAAKYVASFTGPDGESIYPLNIIQDSTITEKDLQCVKEGVENKQWDTTVLSETQLKVFEMTINHCCAPTKTVVKGHAEVGGTLSGKDRVMAHGVGLMGMSFKQNLRKK